MMLLTRTGTEEQAMTYLADIDSHSARPRLQAPSCIYRGETHTRNWFCGLGY